MKGWQGMPQGTEGLQRHCALQKQARESTDTQREARGIIVYAFGIFLSVFMCMLWDLCVLGCACMCM